MRHQLSSNASRDVSPIEFDMGPDMGPASSPHRRPSVQAGAALNGGGVELHQVRSAHSSAASTPIFGPRNTSARRIDVLPTGEPANSNTHAIAFGAAPGTDLQTLRRRSSVLPPPLPPGSDGSPKEREAVDVTEADDTLLEGHEEKKKKPCVRPSLVALIAAGVFFSAMAALSVFLVKRGYHPFQIVYNRGALLTCTTGGYLLSKSEAPLPRDTETGLLVGRKYALLSGFFANADLVCVFIAAQWLPLSEVIVLWSTNPVTATIGAWLLNGDRISPVHIVGILIFLVGAIVTADPVTTFGGGTVTRDAWIGRGVALMASIFSGVRIALNGALHKLGHVHWIATPFWMAMGGVVCCGATSLFTRFEHDPEEKWLYAIVAAASILSSLGQFCLGFGTAHESAVVIGVLFNLDAIPVLFWQPVLFGEPPTWYQYVGVGMVVVAGAVIGAELQLSSWVARTLGCGHDPLEDDAAGDASPPLSATDAATEGAAASPAASSATGSPGAVVGGQQHEQ